MRKIPSKKLVIYIRSPDLCLAEALAAVRSDAEVFAKVQRARQEQQAKLQSLSLEHGTGTPLSLHSEVAAAAAGAPLSAAMQHLLTTALGASLLEALLRSQGSQGSCKLP